MALLFSCLLALLSPWVGANQRQSGDNTRGFSLHDTEAARAKQREADQHLAAGRPGEGIELLQSLIEEHGGEVLGGSRPKFGGRHRGFSPNRASHQPVFQGAAELATRRLLDLDEQAQHLYQRRYGDHAARALAEALEQGSRSALARVGRRWPITKEAERAWWALGDLEMETGNFDDGVRAWSRALGRALGTIDLDRTASAEERGASSAAGAHESRARRWRDALEQLEAVRGTEHCAPLRARVEYALGGGRRAEFPVARAEVQATALRSTDRAMSLPGNHAEGWRDSYQVEDNPFDITRRGSRSKGGRDYVLFPARWGELVFLTTSLQVVALRAFTGEVAWKSGRPSEWDNIRASDEETILKQVEVSDCLVTPAVSRGVVVAPLQIPYVFEPQFTFGDMPIIRELPNRRLFAFDALTGDPLWDTRPPKNWDGESGSLAQRMRVVGPPIIEGSRLLVPLARLRGRIEYSVGCFDLFTGELLWATSLISGQRELNMFGRMAREFCAPPLVIADSQVIALTQLGTLACLDLYTGDVRWEVLYDTIKIQKNIDFDTNQLGNQWHNAPPVVAADVIFATPFDSRDLIAVDLETGGMIWSLNNKTLMQHGLGYQNGKAGQLKLLVGADEEFIYLSGHRLVALKSTGGKVTRNAVNSFGWAFPAGTDLETQLEPDGPRPVLDGERIHVPDDVLYSVDRRTGRLRGKMSWLQGVKGNLMLSEGVLLSLGRRTLTAYFEWEELIEEARRRQRAAPSSSSMAIHLAGLLRSRGRSEWAGGDEGRAARFLDEARSVLEPLVETSEGTRIIGADPRAAEELHQVLRSEARVLRDLARRTRAVDLLVRARKLAPGPEELRDTLLEEVALLRNRNPQAHAKRLNLLLEHCGHLPLVVDPSSDPELSFADRLVPVVGSAPQSNKFIRTTVGLWVLIQRSSLAAEGPASFEEFADLHAILERYPNSRLGRESAAEWAAGRIDERLSSGQREGYAPFEERAQRLLEVAEEQQTPAAFERVGKAFPHSDAAAAAGEARLVLSVAAVDVEQTAAIVLGELPELWSARRASERDLRRMMRLAHVLGESGSHRAREALLDELARYHGELRSDLPGHQGQTLAELAEACRPPIAEPLPEPSFHARVRLRAALAGSYRPLCLVPPSSPQALPVQIFYTDDELVGFSPESPETPLWRTTIKRGEIDGRQSGHMVVIPGKAVLAGGERVFALDASDGSIPWQRSLQRGASVQELSESGGVAVLSVLQRSTWNDTHGFESLAIGIDAEGGHELWRLPVPADLAGGRAFADGRRLIFLPGRSSRRVELRDLFSGRLITAPEVEPLTDPTLPEAFVAGGRLILPRFQAGMWPEQNHVLALDIDTGQNAWRIDIGEGRRDGSELQMVVTHGEEVYLVLRGERRGSISASGAIYQLSPRIGAISSRPIATLDPGDEILGAANRRRMEIDSPYLFVLSKTPNDDRTALRAIHLPHGQRWVTELPYVFEAYTSQMSPAVSSTTVALTWRVARLSQERDNRWHTDLLLLDRATGASRDRRTLPDKLDQLEVSLTALGDALYVCGDREMETLR